MNGWRDRLVNASILIALLGLAFVVSGVALWTYELVSMSESVHQALYQLVIHVLFGALILVLGIHVERSELAPEERFSALVWCYGGFLLMFALTIWGHLGSILQGSLTLGFTSDFLVFTSLGGAFGLIAGVSWGRATRNRLLADRIDEQRETLALLTRLLSHDIRNDMTVVLGYMEELKNHVDAERQSRVEVIQERIETTNQLLADASTLVKSLDDEREFSRMDVSRVLKQEVNTLHEDFPTVAVSTEISTGLLVEADNLINQMFSNLLQNAVFHNDQEDLSIDVTAERSGDTVEVVIADNGRGIPPEFRETCFELGEQGPESDGDGIGLYLVSRLADVYGGSITLDDSSSGGARFEITLPHAET